MQESFEKLEKRVKLIEERNARVEKDKSWETSTQRKILIAVLTYFVVTTFFLVTKAENPFLNAIVPTMGFLLSTLSMSVFKKMWAAGRK